MQKLIKIGITGAYGRMGQNLIQESIKHKNIILHCGIVKKYNKHINMHTNYKIKIIENIIQEINNLDVIIDFTNPSTTLNNLKICKKYKKNIVIGTTGFKKSEIKKIKKYSQHIGIIFSYNFSIGMNLIFKLLKKTIKILDSSYDIEIVETHHRNKVDSPSGTALQLGKIIAKEKKINLDKHSIYRKKEITNIRKKNEIGFSSIRGGDIIGEHKIIFLNNGEKITLSHQANNRKTFSKGAIKAAIWIKNKKIGLFNMMDVLNI